MRKLGGILSTPSPHIKIKIELLLQCAFNLAKIYIDICFNVCVVECVNMMSS